MNVQFLDGRIPIYKETTICQGKLKKLIEWIKNSFGNIEVEKGKIWNEIQQLDWIYEEEGGLNVEVEGKRKETIANLELLL